MNRACYYCNHRVAYPCGSDQEAESCYTSPAHVSRSARACAEQQLCVRPPVLAAANGQEVSNAQDAASRLARRKEDIKARLKQYDESDRRRILNLAQKLVIGGVEKGSIRDTPESIAAAMPEAIADAMQVLNAISEYLSG